MSGDWHDVRCDREDSAPKFPADRPPTRREVWARYHHIFFDRKGHKPTPTCKPTCLHSDEGELETYCRNAWAWFFFDRVARKRWDKHPDWDGEEPVIAEACATHETFPDPFGYAKVVYDLLAVVAKKRTREAA